jgi:hypothetical protein
VISDTVGAHINPESRSGDLFTGELIESLKKLGFGGLISEAELNGKSAEEATAIINEKAWNAYDQKIDPVREQIRHYERDMSLQADVPTGGYLRQRGGPRCQR